MRVLMPTGWIEALQMKRDCPNAVPIAGGTDLLVCWPENAGRLETTYLDLSGCGELRPLRFDDDALELGALTTYWDVLEEPRIGRQFPALHVAAAQVGAIQIQARGTWAGNIANGSPAADGVPVLMASDANVCLASAEGARRVPLDEFYRGYRSSVMRDDELIQSIRIPLRAYDVHDFHKVGPRRAQAITKVGAAIARSDAGWRIVANSVAPTVVRCRTVETLLDNGTTMTRPADLYDALDADVKPIDDIRSTAAYRREVLARVLFHAVLGSPPSH